MKSEELANWHFLPELPEKNVEVLIAYKFDKQPILGYWDGEKWKGSRETIDYMKDCFALDISLNGAAYIYAWAERPNCPSIPNND